MPSRESGKQRASQIPLDYFKHRGPLERGKLRLAGLAALLAVGGWLVGTWTSRGSDTWYSPGPVAAVHARWENDCQQCHTNFTPMRSENWSAALGDAAHATDQKCQTCHPVGDRSSFFGHHPALVDKSMSCTACHSEHHGRMASLTLADDAHCTVCHENIAAHRKDSPTAARASIVPNVSRFDAEHHPDFVSLKNDPRKLKFSAFSHQLHLTPGLATDRDHQPVMTIGLLSEADRAQYRQPSQTDADLVRLDCASCHQADSAAPPVVARLTQAVAGLPTVPPSRPQVSSGAYMAPVNFEQHCRACHALTISPKESAKVATSATALPHRLHSDQIVAEIQRYWSDRYLQDHPEQLNRPLPLPGRAADSADASARHWIDERVTTSLNHVRITCQKCHSTENPSAMPTALRGHDDASVPVADQLFASLLPSVAPTQIPRVWLAHAKFDHAAHRSVNCRDCHVVPPAGREGDGDHPTIIPNLATCVRCHGPVQQIDGQPVGGARFDCLECHRFHDGRFRLPDGTSALDVTSPEIPLGKRDLPKP